MKTETILKQLLEKYEQGNCSTKEEEILHSYFDSFQNIEDAWNEIGIDRKETIRSQILHNVNQRINQRIWDQKSKRSLFLKIAASTILIIGIGLAVNYIETDKPIEVAVMTKTASNGQKITLKLPDGSKVRLNSGSEITYPEVFSDIRRVTLVGEAFFEVTKNPDKKFIVVTTDIITTVLGTSFNVRAYPSEELKVTVEEGRVGVASNNLHVELDIGKQSTYKAINKTLTISEVDVTSHTSWRNGILQFNGSVLPEIFAELERWYGVEIEFNNEQSNNCDLKLEFDNQSLEQVLDQLETVAGVATHLNNSLVKITGIGCED